MSEGWQQHHGDPETIARRLTVAAVHDPTRFAEQLDEYAGCPDCAKAVIAEFSYILGGLALHDHAQVAEDDDRPVGCTCDRPSIPEVVAMASTLSIASNDSAAVGHVLEQILPCRVCMFDVLMSVTAAHVAVLNDTNVAWRPMVENQLKVILGGEHPGWRPVEAGLLGILDENV